jgi:hypothetical protein
MLITVNDLMLLWGASRMATARKRATNDCFSVMKTSFFGQKIYKLFLYSHGFVTMTERAKGRVEHGRSGFVERPECLFQTLARIHDEVFKGGDSYDAGSQYSIDAGADEQGSNFCEDNS